MIVEVGFICKHSRLFTQLITKTRCIRVVGHRFYWFCNDSSSSLFCCKWPYYDNHSTKSHDQWKPFLFFNFLYFFDDERSKQAASKPASFTFIASTSSIMDCYYVYGWAVFLERRLKQSDLCVSVPKNRLEVDTTDKRGKNVVFNVCTTCCLLAAVCTLG